MQGMRSAHASTTRRPPRHRAAQARRKAVPRRPPLRPPRATQPKTCAHSRGHRLLQNMLTALLSHQPTPQQPSWDATATRAPLPCPMQPHGGRNHQVQERRRAEGPVALSWHSPMAVSCTPHAQASVTWTESRGGQAGSEQPGTSVLLGSRNGSVTAEPLRDAAVTTQRLPRHGSTQEEGRGTCCCPSTTSTRDAGPAASERCVQPGTVPLHGHPESHRLVLSLFWAVLPRPCHHGPFWSTAGTTRLSGDSGS